MSYQDDYEDFKELLLNFNPAEIGFTRFDNTSTWINHDEELHNFEIFEGDEFWFLILRTETEEGRDITTNIRMVNHDNPSGIRDMLVRMDVISDEHFALELMQDPDIEASFN